MNRILQERSDRIEAARHPGRNRILEVLPPRNPQPNFLQDDREKVGNVPMPSFYGRSILRQAYRYWYRKIRSLRS